MSQTAFALEELIVPRVEPDAALTWWERERLHYRGADLIFAGHRVVDLVEIYGSPTLFYDRKRIRENIERLNGAFRRTGHPNRVYFAVKANRFGPVLGAIRETGVCGIDAASPGEVQLALAAGFKPENISFTASSVSDEDVEAIGGLPIRINVDSISMMHKLGRRFPGRSIGIRVNPQIGVGMTGQLTYAGSKPSKFGIYGDRFEEALRLAESYRLRVAGVHMHVGSSWLARGLETFLRAVDRLCQFAREVPELEYVNVGGGIGVPHEASDQPVDVDLYASSIVSRVRRRLGRRIEICCEPGDYIVNDSSILASRVTMVEEKGGELFVGLNAGFNAHPQAAHYQFIQEIAHAHRGPSMRSHGTHIVVGNINEVIDNFHTEARLPTVHENDVLVVLNTGGYGSSMSSYHCMRRPAREIMLD